MAVVAHFGACGFCPPPVDRLFGVWGCNLRGSDAGGGEVILPLRLGGQGAQSWDDTCNIAQPTPAPLSSMIVECQLGCSALAPSMSEGQTLVGCRGNASTWHLYHHGQLGAQVAPGAVAVCLPSTSLLHVAAVATMVISVAVACLKLSREFRAARDPAWAAAKKESVKSHAGMLTGFTSPRHAAYSGTPTGRRHGSSGGSGFSHGDGTRQALLGNISNGSSHASEAGPAGCKRTLKSVAKAICDIFYILYDTGLVMLVVLAALTRQAQLADVFVSFGDTWTARAFRDIHNPVLASLALFGALLVANSAGPGLVRYALNCRHRKNTDQRTCVSMGQLCATQADFWLHVSTEAFCYLTLKFVPFIAARYASILVLTLFAPFVPGQVEWSELLAQGVAGYAQIAAILIIGCFNFVQTCALVTGMTGNNQLDAYYMWANCSKKGIIVHSIERGKVLTKHLRECSKDVWQAVWSLPCNSLAIALLILVAWPIATVLAGVVHILLCAVGMPRLQNENISVKPFTPDSCLCVPGLCPCLNNKKYTIFSVEHRTCCGACCQRSSLTARNYLSKRGHAAASILVAVPLIGPFLYPMCSAVRRSGALLPLGFGDDYWRRFAHAVLVGCTPIVVFFYPHGLDWTVFIHDHFSSLILLLTVIALVLIGSAVVVSCGWSMLASSGTTTPTLVKQRSEIGLPNSVSSRSSMSSRGSVAGELEPSDSGEVGPVFTINAQRPPSDDSDDSSDSDSAEALRDDSSSRPSRHSRTSSAARSAGTRRPGGGRYSGSTRRSSGAAGMEGTSWAGSFGTGFHQADARGR